MEKIKTFHDFIFEKKIKEGIRKNATGYEFDFSQDFKDDILPLKFRPYRGKSLSSGDTNYRYYYAYFMDKSDDSTDLLKAIKNIDSTIKPGDFQLLINKAIMGLDKEFNLSSFDTIISPKSSGKVLNRLVKFLEEKSGANLYTDSFVKSTSAEIKLDTEKVDKLPERTKKEIYRILKKTQNSQETFKISSIYAKYRRFFKDFLKFNQENDRKLFNSVEGKKIILVDDYRTSGTTTKEMLSQMIDLGAKEIIVFNLIKLGK